MLSLPQGILASFIGMLVEVQLRHLLRLVHCCASRACNILNEKSGFQKDKHA